MTTPDPRIQRLYDAGFTADDLEALAGDLQFLSTLASAAEVGARSGDLGCGRIDWTPEKEAALFAFLREQDES